MLKINRKKVKKALKNYDGDYPMVQIFKQKDLFILVDGKDEGVKNG